MKRRAENLGRAIGNLPEDDLEILVASLRQTYIGCCLISLIQPKEDDMTTLTEIRAHDYYNAQMEGIADPRLRAAYRRILDCVEELRATKDQHRTGEFLSMCWAYETSLRAVKVADAQRDV